MEAKNVLQKVIAVLLIYSVFPLVIFDELRSISDVAFTLCQVGPVLVSKDGDQKDLTEKVARDYVARLVSQNEEESKEDEDSD